LRGFGTKTRAIYSIGIFQKAKRGTRPIAVPSGQPADMLISGLIVGDISLELILLAQLYAVGLAK
jgi:hypothetical protein